MKVGIYGVTKAGSFVREIIEKIYNPEAEKFGAEPLQVCCYIDVNHRGLLEYDGIMTMQIQEFLKYYFYDVIPTIIVPREIFHFGQPQLALKGIGFNLDDIYMAGRLNKEMLARTAPLDFLMPYLDSDYLPYLEFHIADKCNLNCAACQHFAGLVKEEHFPDFEKFKEGFTKLHSFVSDIGRIRILGGEPLLNPDVSEYVKFVRSLYTYSELYVVTNGILLESMPESFYETMAENNAKIHLSLYPPFNEKCDEWQKYCEDRGVGFETDGKISEFSKMYTLEKTSDATKQFYSCNQANCNNYYEGKVAPCFLPFMGHYFNEYFDKNLPTGGAIDLFEDGLTTRKLKERLMTPFERCGFCVSYQPMKWRQINNPSTLDDWVV